MRRPPIPVDCPPRRGALLIIVLVCLLAIVALAGTLLKLAVTQHRQSRVQFHQLQAEWLTLSGLDRAARQRANDPDWTGETWTPTLGLGGETVRVDMRLAPSDGSPQEIVATITWGEADLPRLHITRRRQLVNPTADEGGRP
ncbi:MAG: hypothetical protein ACK5Q5_06005 [Planctomycetaceae bacterium]